MKMIRSLVVYLVVMLSLTSFKPVGESEGSAVNNELLIKTYISKVYQQIDFDDNKKPSFDVFSRACQGYLNLKSEGKLSSEKELLTICDMSLSSSEDRMWVIDLAKKKVLYNTFVAHGQGSGDEYAYAFSNNFDSHQTSLGFYVTTDTYDGDHGMSLHLVGMDKGFNDAAFDRGIVVHGAKYVSQKFIRGNDHLGRSWGCPAVPAKLSNKIINTIKDSTCLFIYYPEENYLKSTVWLKKKIMNLPRGSIYQDMQAISLPKPKARVIEYRNKSGKVDSVVTLPTSN